MLGGLGLVGVAASLNASHAAETDGWSSPTVIAIVALAFASALAVPVVTAFWRTGSKGLALLVLAGLVAGESFGFQLSAGRLLETRAQREQQVETAAGPWRQAKEALDLSVKEREAECAGGLGLKCSKLRVLEDAKRTALAALPPPMSHTLIADATGLPPWLVDIASAMAFSTGLLLLGFGLIAFGGHALKARETEVVTAVLEPLPDERERVLSWVREYRQRHGRSPKIPEVQQAFPGLAKSAAWRRLQKLN
jgi:hypothetical protein